MLLLRTLTKYNLNRTAYCDSSWLLRLSNFFINNVVMKVLRNKKKTKVLSEKVIIKWYSTKQSVRHKAVTQRSCTATLFEIPDKNSQISSFWPYYKLSASLKMKSRTPKKNAEQLLYRAPLDGYFTNINKIYKNFYQNTNFTKGSSKW